MRTLTEFASPTLKNALAKKQELTAAGKTAEELPAAMGEALKLEGDKLTYLLAALEATNERLGPDFKRVVVSSLNEGETAPSSAKLIGEKYYTVENYPQAHKSAPADERGGGRDGKGRRGGKGGRDGGKRGGPGGDRGGRGGGDRDRGAGGGGRDAGGRGPRGPRPPQGAAAGPGGLPKPLPLPKPLTPKTDAPAAPAKSEEPSA
jgi:hypothetical protein